MLTDSTCDPLIEIQQKFSQVKDRIEKEGGRVADYRGLMEEECARGVERDREANSELLSYFTTRKGNTPISEVL